MYLDAVSNNLVNADLNAAARAVERTKKKTVFETWEYWQPSHISHHGQLCCEIAREWITATDFSQLNGDCKLSGPRWLRQRFNWGASTFPIYWCEAVRRDTLDCGALAALAYEVFTVRGVRCYRAQLVQKFSDVATAQWTDNWRENGAPLDWINGDLIYHEACAIETGGRSIKVWDPSAGWWVGSKPANGYGALLALRISGFNLEPGENLIWNEHTLEAGEWQEIS